MTAADKHSRNFLDIPLVDKYYMAAQGHSWADALSSSLTNMLMNADNAAMALMLFDACDNSISNRGPGDPIAHRNRAWMRIACRDTIMSIYHFAKAFESVKAALHHIAEFDGKYDRQKFRPMTKIFSDAFPQYNAIRDAVAHIAEATKDPQQIEKHSFSGSYDGGTIKIDRSSRVVINGMLSGRTYTNTFGGLALEAEISKDNCEILRNIVNETFEIVTSALDAIKANHTSK